MVVKDSMKPFLTLYIREVRRFAKVLVQTVFSPIVSSGLYLLIFGISLGRSIDLGLGEELTYLAFLIPGLVMMSVLNNAFQNSASSVVSGKFSGDLEDLKVVPLSSFAILWALAFGGITRGLVVGSVTFLVGQGFYFFIHGHGLSIAHPGTLFLFLLIGGLSFAMFGISVAFWSKTMDHLSAISSFVILPLIYLGGVFFSISTLPPFWQVLSKANPLLYFINGVRYGILGLSDVGVNQALVISCCSLVFFHFMALRVIKKAKYGRW